ncbi:MAG: hypothetical protein HWE14_05165 [Flavobacteriia bacterium]|nr:hypothetical protein [Flavobacteriia bacterium]
MKRFLALCAWLLLGLLLSFSSSAQEGETQSEVQSTDQADANTDTETTERKILVQWDSKYYVITKVGEALTIAETSVELQLEMATEESESIDTGDFLKMLSEEAKDNALKLQYKTTSESTQKEYVRLLDKEGITPCLGTGFTDQVYQSLLANSAENEDSREHLTLEMLTPEGIDKIEITKLEMTTEDLVRKYANVMFKDEVGRFILLKHVVETKGDEVKEVTLTQLRLRVVEGFVVEILAETEDFRQFRLTFGDAQDIFRFSEHIQTIQLKDVQDEGTYIALKDILYFRPEENIGYRPDNEIVTLNKDKKLFILTQTYSLNTIIDARIYTDFRSLIGDVPNGLVNFELNSELPINSRNNGKFLWISHISPSLRYSRFDQGLNQAVIDNGEINSALSIYQQSKLSAGFDIGIVRSLRSTGRYEVRLDGVLSYLITDLYDTTETLVGKDYNTIYSGFKLNQKINLNKRFWFDVNTELGWLWAMGSTEIQNFENYMPMWGINAQISYRPDPGSTDGFYLRYGAYDDLTSRNGDYTFIQFGYRVSLSRAWSEATSGAPSPKDAENQEAPLNELILNTAPPQRIEQGDGGQSNNEL